MIISTFHRLKSHRLLFLSVLLINNTIFVIRSQQGYIPVDIIPGSPLPDTAFFGYTPIEAWIWYEHLEESGRIVVLQLGLLDVLGIIPSYTLLLGSQLVATNCPVVLCYIPLWTAIFDLIESVTHFAAVLSRHLGTSDDGCWIPSGFHLIIASSSTQFKISGLALSLLLVFFYGLKTNHFTFKQKKS